MLELCQRVVANTTRCNVKDSANGIPILGLRFTGLGVRSNTLHLLVPNTGTGSEKQPSCVSDFGFRSPISDRLWSCDVGSWNVLYTFVIA